MVSNALLVLFSLQSLMSFGPAELFEVHVALALSEDTATLMGREVAGMWPGLGVQSR